MGRDALRGASYPDFAGENDMPLTYLQIGSWNIEHFLHAVLCPVLVIQGENDEYGSEMQVNSIVNNVSGRSIKWMVPDAKHTPHKEKPDLVEKESIEFIDSL